MKNKTLYNRSTATVGAEADVSQGEKMKNKNWAPDDFVRISRRASGKINFPICDVLAIIEDWKSFCLARGKAMGFDLDISKLEKSVNDQFVGMALPAPGSIPIPEHHTSDPMTELSIQTWQKFAGEIMRGNRAFCLAHEIKRIKVTPKKNYTKKEAAAYLGVSVKRIGQFLEEGKLKRAAETQGNKTLIPGWSILELEKIRNNK